LAKALAAYLTGHEKNLVRLDMSAYRSVHALIGVPGERSTADVQQVPLLTRVLRTNPYGVLLLDEIEKADREVWLLFLQGFDSGRITDSLGNEIYLRNTVVVMTSNVGFSIKRAIIPTPGENPDQLRAEQQHAALAALANTFPREFLGRVDEILLFKPITAEIMRAFVEQKIRQLEEITERRIYLTTAAFALLQEKGFSLEYGARDLNRAVDDLLGYRLAHLKLSVEWPSVKDIQVDELRNPNGVSELRVSASMEDRRA
jgi:ATP-dependent Clp protease ATP-binding subunit ClpB